MVRSDFLKLCFSVFLATGISLFAVSNILAHSGHKHETLPISLPEVTAQVNGDDIKKEAILRELKKVVRKYKARGKTLSPEELKSTAKNLIQDEIKRILLLQKGKEIGVEVTPQMVDQKLNQIKSRYKSKEVFEHKLVDQGMTLEQYREEIRTDLLMDNVIKKEVEPGIKINPEEAKTYYDQNKHKFRTEEKRRASVILIKIHLKLGAQGENRARKKIESIRKQAIEGAGFDSLAQKFSQDSLASKGGDLGYFAKNRMLPAFNDRAFKMKAGEVSEVFKTRHGFHILKLTDVKPGKESPFEKEKEKIRKLLTREKMAEATGVYLENLKKKADIKTYF